MRKIKKAAVLLSALTLVSALSFASESNTTLNLTNADSIPHTFNMWHATTTGSNTLMYVEGDKGSAHWTWTLLPGQTGTTTLTIVCDGVPVTPVACSSGMFEIDIPGTPTEENFQLVAVPVGNDTWGVGNLGATTYMQAGQFNATLTGSQSVEGWYLESEIVPEPHVEKEYTNASSLNGATINLTYPNN